MIAKDENKVPEHEPAKAEFRMEGEVEYMGEGEPTDKAVFVTPEMIAEEQDGTA